MECILQHGHVFGEHHGNTGAVSFKPVLFVAVVVGEHEVEAVPQVIMTSIVHNIGVGHKFKIDAIAMATDLVVDDLHTVAFPAMDTIGGSKLGLGVGAERIATDQAIVGMLAVDAEKSIIQFIVADNNISGVGDPDCCDIIVTAIAGMLYQKAFHQHMAALYIDDLVFLLTIYHGEPDAAEGQRFIYFDVPFPVMSGIHQDGITGFRLVDSLLYAAHWTARTYADHAGKCAGCQ